MAFIQTQNLSHSYLANADFPQDFALKELDLSWHDGGAYALLGPSGCGKSTLLNILSGLIRPSKGRVRIDGQDVTDQSAQERHIAKVFQFPVVYETLSVYDNLAFPLLNRGLNRMDTAKRVSEVATLLGLTDQLDKNPASLAGDARQLVSLGRGLVRTDVNAILFDEPLTVIDPQRKWHLRTHLRQLHRQFKLTMIYVTHDQTEALTFADTVMVMHEGRVLQSGTPQELFDKPAQKFVGRFIGSPGMNFIPCQMNNNVALLDGYRLSLHQSYGSMDPDLPLEIGIRPEFMRFSRDAADLSARLLNVENSGRRRIAHLGAAGTTICVSLPADQEIPADNHHVRIDPRRANLYAAGHLMEPRR